MKRLTLSLLLSLLTVLSTNAIAQDFSQSVNYELAQLLEKSVLQSQDIQWELTAEHVSRTSGIRHIYYRQLVNGIPVYGTESGLHLKSNGDVVASDNRFINNTIEKVQGSAPSLTAIQAVQAAADHLNYSVSEVISELEIIGGVSQQVVLSDGGISRSPIPVKLMFQLNEANQLVLVWELSIKATNQQEWWNARVDASSGTIVDKNNYMVSCAIEHNHSIEDVELNYNNNLYDIPNYKEVETVVDNVAGCTECYEVFALPLESPYHGARTFEVLPADPIASPFGWHDTDGIAGAEFTTTEGNNVNAFDDGMGGYQPDPGTSLQFTGYPFDEVWTNSNQYDDASITQLFWANNVIHDVFYQYGFDEAAGNFQVNNYGNGGLGNDSVNAEGQKGIVCNAFMGTPPDGSSPTMQMFVCGDKDGDFDSLVVFHEWGHGISNRLTGGPANSGCLNNTEQMGEGWSDWFGIAMTIEPGDAGTDSRGVGSYLLGQGIGGPGGREYPYSTDVTINPHTYDNVGSVSIPHGVGTIWTAMLWEVTWALIDQYGYDTDIYTFTGDVTQDAGNVQALALVTEGMKLQPCSPGFVDGRDAIFAADLAIYGGANECLLWDAFAKRGLGFSADQGSSNSVSDGTAAFDSPVPALNTAEEICVGQGVQVYGGGTPIGGTYSGPGVTDDGNGTSYTFDPGVAGVGVHTIEYNVASACATGAATDTIEVLADEPVLECQDVTLELDASGEVILTVEDVVTNLGSGGNPVDNCGLTTTLTLSQELFTCDDRGANVITVTLTDTDGNSSTCTPTVTISDPLEVCPPLSVEDNEFAQNLNIFPNPSNGQITIANSSNYEIRSATIVDINGRTVQDLDVVDMESQTTFSIDKLANGMYFIKIEADNASIVKRILKK